MTFFPDVNVWLALVVGEHPHARQARNWAEEADRDWLVLNRITQMGLLRLLTNPAVMRRDTMTGTMAWHALDKLLDHVNIRFVGEPAGIGKVWRGLTTADHRGPNFWTDTYLAGFARTTGFTLVTFDRGFSKYLDIPVRILDSR